MSLFGIAVWDSKGAETSLTTGDEVRLEKVPHGKVTFIELSVIRDNRPLPIGNEKVCQKSLALFSFSRLNEHDLYQALLLIADLLALGGVASTSHLLSTDGVTKGSLIIE